MFLLSLRASAAALVAVLVALDWTGVIATEVGYSQGSVEDPSYEQVCSGNTGHSEVVQVTYNPQQVRPALLSIFSRLDCESC
jgi:peptide methionine sulfoxide reductase MsrA